MFLASLGLISGFWYMKFVFMNFTLFLSKAPFLSSLEKETIKLTDGFALTTVSWKVAICSLLFNLLFFNFFGLLPYFFSFQSKFFFVFLVVSLSIWGGINVSSYGYSWKGYLSHMCPQSSPMPLAPFLVLVEGLSNFLRPFTLFIRISANMCAGHVLLGLVSEYSTTFLYPMGLMSSLIWSSAVVGYTLFEVAVCLIQAYVFSLLLCIYGSEHTTAQ